MADIQQESPKGNDLVIPNDLDRSQSVDSQTNLTIRLTKDSGRKCYVDPHEAFPQATYYLNHNLKRPNYYLKKEQRFNKKILIQHANPNHHDSLLSSPSNAAKKRRKKKSKHKANAPSGPNSKMEVESESDDEEDSESDDDEEEEDDDDDAFNGDDHDHDNFADDELFSDANNGVDAAKRHNKNGGNVDHRNFLNVFPKRNQEDDQKSDSLDNYELDADKLGKMGKGQKGFSDEDLSPLAAPLKRKRKKFGAWDGVFVSCLLNIFGVIMFLRLGFVVGQAGLWYTFLIILLSSVVTTLTTLSMAAIATNGEQRAGGAYYMISRTLGPAIGGSVGVLFSIGMSIAVSMYVIGFCETIVQQVGPITSDPTNDIRLYGSLLVTILLLISVFGISWIIKVQFVLLGALLLAIGSFMIGSFGGPGGANGEYEDIVGVDGWLNGNLIDNFTPKFQDIPDDEIDYNFFVCFGIFFPAATGIMAGANLSGDLRNPSHDIPLGTLAAIIVSTIAYMVMALLLAVSCVPFLPDDKESGLIHNYIIMSEVSVWQPLILFGIYAATISSALTSLVGAPRILLSLSRDNLIPYFDYFSVTNADGEPIRAYIACYVIALGCIFIGHLNIVAPLITQFFLGTYAFISFACFSMSISRSPGWRPSFIYYNKYTALLGGIICIVIMLFIHTEYAVMAIIIAGTLYQYISWTRPTVNWGSAFASRAKWKANDSSLKLYQYGDHVKNFQPSFLVLCKDNIFDTDHNHKTQSLIEYVLTLRHGFGTIVYSTVLLGSFDEYINVLSHKSKANRGYYLPLAKKKAAFYEQVVSNNIREGARLLMQLTGIGRLRTNTVVLGWKTSWSQELVAKSKDENHDPEHLAGDSHSRSVSMDDMKEDQAMSMQSNKYKFSNDEYVGLLMDVLRMGMGFMICRGLESLPFKFGRKYAKSNEGSGNNNKSSSPRKADAAINEILSAKEQHHDANMMRHDVFDEDEVAMNELQDAKDTQAILENLQPTTIDIWWLLDDGGLTLLVPHIMSLSKFWKKISRKGRCRIRVFLVAEEDIVDPVKKQKDLEKQKEKEQAMKQKDDRDEVGGGGGGDASKAADDRSRAPSFGGGGGGKGRRWSKREKSSSILDIHEIARISRQGILDDAVLQTVEDSTELWKEELKALMNKFRLNILGPFTVKSGRDYPTNETISKFCKLTKYDWDKTEINGKFIKNNIKLIRWLRVSELIHAYSRHQKCTMITAPFPLSFPTSSMYLGVCDMLTQNNYNATILIRGSGQNCLTFYSE